MSESGSTAEKVVKLLVDSSKATLHTTVTYDYDKSVQLLRWNCAKTMGSLPRIFPCSGERVTIKRSYLPQVKKLDSKNTGAALFCQGNTCTSDTIIYLNFFPRRMTHFIKVQKSYTFLVELFPAVHSHGISKNPEFYLKLVQKKIVQWCFTYFNRYKGKSEISVPQLLIHFPGLQTFCSEDRDIFIEDALRNFSKGQLIFFCGCVVTRLQIRKAMLTVSISVPEIAAENNFERFLSTCWVCLRHPLTEVLQSLNVIAAKISTGFEVRSQLLSTCVAAVLSVVSLCVKCKDGRSIPEISLQNLFLLSKESRHQLAKIQNGERGENTEEKLFHSALDIRKMSVAHQLDHSLSVNSLFSQAQTFESDNLDCRDIPLFSIGVKSYQSEEIPVSSNEPRRPLLDCLNSSKLDWMNCLEVQSCILRCTKEEIEVLQLSLSSFQEDSKGTELDALEAVRESVRKRRKMGS